MTTDRTLDYRPRLVEANRPYRMGVAGDANAFQYWAPGVILDQGREGSCVGHGVVAEWLASPVRGKPLQVNREPVATAGHRVAVGVYEKAKEIDEWEGVDYDGTSVRAGMLVGRERGWWEGFRWAFNMGELRAALDLGPVVIGIQVLERMWDPEPNGDWIPEGPEVGWHCVLLTGYSPNYYGHGPRYTGPNSWGLGWGKSGRFAISPDNLNKILFKAGGEAAVATGRKP